MHRADEGPTWFGVIRDANNEPISRDYERYTAVIPESLSAQREERFLKLVSFIGQTRNELIITPCCCIFRPAQYALRVGKNTLAKVLVGFIGNSSDKSVFRSPVVGSPNDHLPTLADVHPTPICGPIMKGNQYYMLIARDLKAGKIYQEVRGLGKPKSSMDNHRRRTFESAVLHKLLGSQIPLKSLDQFALPHGITVVSATDNSVNAKQWDAAEATRTLFADVDDAPDGDNKFKNYKLFWQARGKTIKSIGELLQSFYSAITVIRNPAKPGYMRIRDQLDKVHQKIFVCCNSAYFAVRMLLNVDNLHTYIQCAFDHFSRNLDVPFNFVKVSLRNNPIPLDFGGNILKLAIAIK